MGADELEKLVRSIEQLQRYREAQGFLESLVPWAEVTKQALAGHVTAQALLKWKQEYLEALEAKEES